MLRPLGGGGVCLMVTGKPPNGSSRQKNERTRNLLHLGGAFTSRSKDTKLKVGVYIGGVVRCLFGQETASVLVKHLGWAQGLEFIVSSKHLTHPPISQDSSKHQE